MTLYERFVKNGFVVVENVLSKDMLDLLTIDFKLMRDNTKFAIESFGDEFNDYSDNQVPKSFFYYSPYCFESLLIYLKPKIEEVVGKSLLPTYSYARIMESGASMAKHKDRPACQFSATICIQDDVENPYSLYIENYSGDVSSIVLQPGSMIVYHGTQLNHWREEWYGTEHIQTFLHYVDINGPYKDYKYDKRPMLGLSSDFKGVTNGNNVG